jgi:multiple antibiotic resistance protein
LLQQTLTCAIMALVLGITLILMLLSDRIIRLIGKSGASILSRVMGLILSAVAVQMVYSALHGELGPG